MQVGGLRTLGVLIYWGLKTRNTPKMLKKPSPNLLIDISLEGISSGLEFGVQRRDSSEDLTKL